MSQTEPSVPGESYAAEARRQELMQLAAEQGVGPITDLDSLKADFWPEDENVKDFVQTVREHRRALGM